MKPFFAISIFVVTLSVSIADLYAPIFPKLREFCLKAGFFSGSRDRELRIKDLTAERYMSLLSEFFLEDSFGVAISVSTLETALSLPRPNDPNDLAPGHQRRLSAVTALAQSDDDVAKVYRFVTISEFAVRPLETLQTEVLKIPTIRSYNRWSAATDIPQNINLAIYFLAKHDRFNDSTYASDAIATIISTYLNQNEPIRKADRLFSVLLRYIFVHGSSEHQSAILQQIVDKDPEGEIFGDFCYGSDLKALLNRQKPLPVGKRVSGSLLRQFFDQKISQKLRNLDKTVAKDNFNKPKLQTIVTEIDQLQQTLDQYTRITKSEQPDYMAVYLESLLAHFQKRATHGAVGEYLSGPDQLLFLDANERVLEILQRDPAETVPSQVYLEIGHILHQEEL